MDRDPEDWGSIIYPDSEPKQAKGGVFAPTDINLIKEALLTHAKVNADKLTPTEDRQIVALLHRLNRVG